MMARMLSNTGVKFTIIENEIYNLFFKSEKPKLLTIRNVT